jgi:hypothetical protein
MSCYSDIYNDYPLRCAALWEMYNASARENNLEITLMLACAAGGFATPFEHLKIQPGEAKENRNHPAFFNHNEQKYKKCLSDMNKALGGNPASSILFRNIQLDDCFYTQCTNINEIRDIAESRYPCHFNVRDQSTRSLVKILRNAIAHNNLYAFARGHSNEISELTFFSKLYEHKGEKREEKGFEVLSLPAEAFRSFLTSWFSLLKKYGRTRPQLKLVIANSLDQEAEPRQAYA